MEVKEKLGKRIKEIREKKKITQEALASRSGVERTFISHIERGGRNISLETIEKVAAGLGVSIADLFTSKPFK